MLFKKQMIMPVLLSFSLLLTGCGSSEGDKPAATDTGEPNVTAQNSTPDPTPEEETSPATELEVRFGYDGEPFTLHLEDNETAKEIARDVGTSDWNLPIYHFDDFDNWEVMQYYDISSRYEIPSDPQTVTSEKAGEVYYSDPNRIILFYQDAEVQGEYTKVGTINETDALRTAVEENPVLEGWGNKIVSVSAKN